MTLYALERTTADKEYVLGVDVDEFLLGMLAATLRRNIDNIALKEFQHSLLHSLSGHVARDGGIVRLARDFVNLINEYNTPLCLLHVKVSLLKKSREYALNVLSDIAGLRENGRVHNRERDIKHARNGLREQSLSCSGRAHHQDITLFKLDVVLRSIWRKIVLQALVVVVNSHCKLFLCSVLTNHILVEECGYLMRLEDLLLRVCGSLRSLLLRMPKRLFHILMPHLHTIRADAGVQALEQERNFVLAPAAEHAVSQAIALCLFLVHIF